jgi:hypothetical protein
MASAIESLRVSSAKIKYSMLNLILVLVCKFHYTTSSMPSDDYKEFLFENYPNHVLTLPLGLANLTQMTTKVSDKMDCVFTCLKGRPWCRSVNFKIKSENNGLHICELISTDKYLMPKYLIPAQGFTHLSIKVDKLQGLFFIYFLILSSILSFLTSFLSLSLSFSLSLSLSLFLSSFLPFF